MSRLLGLASGNLWTILFIGCAICARWNWQAALIFALAVVAGQATTRLDLSQVHLLGAYTLLAVVAFFFFDRYAGVMLAAIGLVIGAHIIGLVDNRLKIIAGEVILLAGMLFCAFSGPSGGYFARDTAVLGNRPDTTLARRAVHSEEAKTPLEENI